MKNRNLLARAIARLILLILLELASVYLIMPMLDSQLDDAANLSRVSLAYWLYNNIGWLRIVGLVVVAYPMFLTLTQPHRALEQGSQVRVWMLENVKQTTIRSLIEQSVQAGSIFYTDEHGVYNCLSEYYKHKTVNHSQGEYARDEDGDGKHEVHVNTMECFGRGRPCGLLRPWLRGHRGLSQARLPYYLGFFEYLYNLRKRGQLALTGLLTLLLTT